MGRARRKLERAVLGACCTLLVATAWASAGCGDYLTVHGHLGSGHGVIPPTAPDGPLKSPTTPGVCRGPHCRRGTPLPPPAAPKTVPPVAIDPAALAAAVAAPAASSPADRLTDPSRKPSGLYVFSPLRPPNA